MTEHRFDGGGEDDGRLLVGIGRSYGDDYVEMETVPAVGLVHLTAEQARAVAADLLAHADALDGRKS